MKGVVILQEVVSMVRAEGGIDEAVVSSCLVEESS